ncbi:MAG: MFS transporter [Trueperaceae bacterium]|nr:MFS transporter [Trueperaceae bacterium]
MSSRRTGAFGRYADLLSVPGARVYFTTQAVTQIGAAVFELGAIWFTLRLTESPVITAIVAASTFLPALISPLAGLASDAASPKRVLLTIDVIRGLMSLALSVYVFAAGFPPPLVIVLFSLAVSILNRIYLPARFAWLGAAIPDETLVHANAFASIISNLRLLFGGLVAALLLSQDSPGSIFLFSGALYLISSALLLRLPEPPVEATSREASTSKRALDRASTLLRDSRLTSGLIFVALSNLILVGAWIVGSPILAERIAPGTGLYAFMQACYGVGVAVGSLLVASLSRTDVSMRRIISAGFVLQAVAFLWFALVGSRVEASLASLVFGIATPAINVTVPTILQRLSRVIGSAGGIFGLYGLANAGAISASILLYGFVAAAFAPPPMFFVPAAAALVAVLCVRWLVVSGFLGSHDAPSVSR